MKYYILIILFASFYCSAFTDSGPPPEPMSTTSPNSTYKLRVIPPGLDEILSNKKSKATLYKLEVSEYKEVTSFTLLNKVAPVKVLVTDNGVVFTFDNWRGLGSDNVVTIYSKTGDIIKSYLLIDLFNTENYNRVVENRTVASIYWRCTDSVPYVSDAKVIVRATTGGRFIFNAESGEFKYENEGGCDWR